MTEQPEEKTEQKPLSHAEKHAETLDDVLAARTLEEILKQTAKKLPQEDKNKQAGGSSQSDRQARSTMFIAPRSSIVCSYSGATVFILW